MINYYCFIHKLKMTDFLTSWIKMFILITLFWQCVFIHKISYDIAEKTFVQDKWPISPTVFLNEIQYKVGNSVCGMNIFTNTITFCNKTKIINKNNCKIFIAPWEFTFYQPYHFVVPFTIIDC